MTTRSLLGRSSRRPFLLLLLGIGAGGIEVAAGGLPAGGGFESGFLGRFLFAAAVAAGISAEAAIPYPRLRYAIAWAAVGAFGDALLSPHAAGAARLALGAGIWLAVAAPGPLHPVPWSAAVRGAAGAAIGAFLTRTLGVLGSPLWILPGVEALAIGLALSEGRGVRLARALAFEREGIRGEVDAAGSARAARAEALVRLAVSAVEETEAVEETTGLDLETDRREIAVRARRALGLLRRMGGLPPDLEEDLAARLLREEAALREIHRVHLARAVAG